MHSPERILQVIFLASLLMLPCISLAAQHTSYSGFSVPVPSFLLSDRNVTFASSTSTASINIATSDTAVYRYAYASYDGGAWIPIALSGTSMGGAWLNGSSIASVTIRPENFSISSSRLTTRRNFVVTYSCSRTAQNTWDCHDGWQIWQFNATLVDAASTTVTTSWSGELAINGGFETGNLNGWTYSAGFVAGSHPDNSVYAMPQSGSYCAYNGGSSSTSGYIYQDVNLTPYSGFIDAGVAIINASGWGVSSEPTYDYSRVQIIFLSSAKAVISTAADSGNTMNGVWWKTQVANYAVPPNTRYARLWGNTYEDGWDSGSLDSFSAMIGYPSVCTGPASESCAITNGAGTRARQCTIDGWGSWGACQVTSCNAGYEISGNSCTPVCTGSPTQSCTIPNGTGTQSRTCTDGVWSSWGTCTYSSCNSGYTWDGTNCIPNLCTGSSTQSCYIANGTGTQSRMCTNYGTYYGWSSWSTCTVASCNSGFIISANSCVEGTIPPNCVHFDGNCPSGCTGYDVDCHGSIAELNLPIPSAASYTNIIYIDPVLGSPGNNGLTPSTALRSWRDVSSFNANTAYLQKRGTTDTLTTSFSIHTYADGILFGAYGDTSLQRPVMYQYEPTYQTLIRMDGDDSTIRDLVLRTRGSCAAIGSRNEPWVRFFTIYNVAIEGTDQSHRFWDGFDVSYNLGTRILNTSVNYIGEDGFWISDSDYVEIGYSSVENMNQRYFDNSAADDHCFWVPPGTDLGSIDVHSEQYSTGDAIQFESVEHVHVHHTYIDKSSPNKHAFISNNWLTINIFENNYVLTAQSAGGSHVAGVHMVMRNNVWEYNSTLGEVYSPAGVKYGGFYGWATPLEIYNNVFINHYKPVDSRGTSQAVVANNVFYNVFGLGWNTWDGDKAADVNNNIMLHWTGGYNNHMDPIVYDYNEFITSEGYTGRADLDGSHSFVANPLFVSPAQRTLPFCTGPGLSRCVMIPNFHLQASSPARGAGTAAVYNSLLSPLAKDHGVWRDLDGNAINTAGQINLGPYQG